MLVDSVKAGMFFFRLLWNCLNIHLKGIQPFGCVLLQSRETANSKFLVSNETVVMRRWESETWNSVLSNELIKVELPPWKIWKAKNSLFENNNNNNNPQFLICSDEALTLETLAFQNFRLIKPNFREKATRPYKERACWKCPWLLEVTTNMVIFPVLI